MLMYHLPILLVRFFISSFPLVKSRLARRRSSCEQRNNNFIGNSKRATEKLRACLRRNIEQREECWETCDRPERKKNCMHC